MQKKSCRFLVTKFHVCALQKPLPPPPCPLTTTIFLFIYIISSLCLKQRKKMEQISEKNKTSRSNREKKKKKVDVNEKKKLRIRVVGTASFLSYWAWKYDIKKFRILELCLPLSPLDGAKGQRAKKNVIVLITSCTKNTFHHNLNCETEWISLKYETGKTEDLLMWQNINSII